MLSRHPYQLLVQYLAMVGLGLPRLTSLETTPIVGDEDAEAPSQHHIQLLVSIIILRFINRVEIESSVWVILKQQHHYGVGILPIISLAFFALHKKKMTKLTNPNELYQAAPKASFVPSIRITTTRSTLAMIFSALAIKPEQ